VFGLLAELAERFPERWFGKLFQLIRRRGLVWNHKRVWRVYSLIRLNERRRGKKRLPNQHPMPLVAVDQIHSSWSIDFMSDVLGTDGAFVRLM
jgi:putative transposase